MLLDRFRMDDRVAVVTGASRGIGAACARALAEMGADVVLAARTADTLDTVRREIEGLGRRAITVRCDVMVRADLEAVVQNAIDTFGRIDVLVNNAGGYPPLPALRTSERAFEEAFRFNVTSAFLMSRFAIPHMLERDGGAIVNISSAAGRIPQSGFVAYGTAKAAMSFMTRQLAHEFAPRVRVNAIAVGATETSALDPVPRTSLCKGKMEGMTPMKRLGQPEDIALAALYLASPASSWVTGKIFEIDGGTEATNWPF